MSSDSSSSDLKHSQSWDISIENAYNLALAITSVLAEYSWIYKTRNTDIFVYDVLEKIPTKWIEAISSLTVEEFREIPYGYSKDDWPSSLKQFLTKTIQLAELRFSKNICYPEETTDCSKSVKKNIPLKKQKEITVMSNLVNNVCKISNCNRVLDVGSGLGYLDETLHHIYGLHCVGVDCVKRLTDGAQNRLKTDPCISCMCHKTLKVENHEDLIRKLQIILKNAVNSRAVCVCEGLLNLLDPDRGYETVSHVMVGLHCCGNLMQDMMKLFYRMNELQSFVCLGCCYNKINLDDFPMSKTVRNVLDSLRNDYPQWQPCISGFRLASHATRADLNHYNTKHLEIAERNLIFRAIIEYYIKKENIEWKKPKRRVRPEDLSDFRAYCDIMFQNADLITSNTDHQERMKMLQDIYSAKENLFPRVKILLVLQTLLQPLYECFVMLDRVLYFKEKSIETKVFILWDDSMSPRNMALCAFKN